MSIQELTKHPEMMNAETLYELRRLVAEYPYYQPARLLMLKNLYLMHDSSFDDELRRSAIYFTDRKVLFNLVESAHYRLKKKSPQSFSKQPDRRQNTTNDNTESRTVSLIDTYLEQIPDEEKEEERTKAEIKAKHRKPTAADATVDYVAYLLSTDFEELQTTEGEEINTQDGVSMNGNDLIDRFIENDGGKFVLQDTPEIHPEVEVADDSDGTTEEEFMTETLASIYVKQGRYQKALDIMDKINETSNKKNRYFEDQQRFLKKLILIQNSNNKQ